MKARYWSIAIVLMLINYLIFATISTRLFNYEARLQRDAPPIAMPTFTPAPVEANFIITPITPQTVPTSTPVPPEPAPSEGVVVRAGPGDMFEVVEILADNTTFPVVGRTVDSTWWQVDVNGTMGWVSSDVVQVNNAETVPVVE